VCYAHVLYPRRPLASRPLDPLEDSTEGDRSFRRDARSRFREETDQVPEQKSKATLALLRLPRLIGIVKWYLSGAQVQCRRRRRGKGRQPFARLSTQ